MIILTRIVYFDHLDTHSLHLCTAHSSMIRYVNSLPLENGIHTCGIKVEKTVLSLQALSCNVYIQDSGYHNEILIHSLEILSCGFLLKIINGGSFSPPKVTPSKTVHLLLVPNFLMETVRPPLFANVTPDTMSKSILVSSILTTWLVGMLSMLRHSIYSLL